MKSIPLIVQNNVEFTASLPFSQQRLRQHRVHSGAGFNDHRSTRSSARAVSDSRMRPRIRS